MVNSRSILRAWLLCVLAGFLGGMAGAQDRYLPRCGNEGELACRTTDWEWWYSLKVNPPGSRSGAACDTGLTRQRNCVQRGAFGICRRWETRCVASTRHLLQQPGNQFPGSWADWALANQRDLAQDEPINWVMHLGTHNSMNARLDAYLVDPNQHYSITGQLDLGARLITLDVHWKTGGTAFPHARLCHALEGPRVPGLCGSQGRFYANGIKEIRNWLDRHPDEIVVLYLEDYLKEDERSSPFINKPLEAYLGSRIFTPADLGCISIEQKIRSDVIDLPVCEPGTDFWPSRRQLLTAKKQIIVLDNPTHGALWSHWWSNGPCDLPGNCFSYPFEGSKLKNFDFTDCSISDESILEANLRFSALFEDRTLTGTTFAPVGWMKSADVKAAATCNVNLVVFDFISSVGFMHPSLLPWVLPELPDNRQLFAVWSWKLDDAGDRGDCALFTSDEDASAPNNHWESRACQERHYFACAAPRSESKLPPSRWRDPIGTDWIVTSRTGPWTDGQSACRKESPALAFGVPVNGYQNEKLKKAVEREMDERGLESMNVWLNYTDQWEEGEWIIPRTADSEPRRSAK